MATGETARRTAPAKTPVGGAVRDAGKERAMVILSRKAAEQNPASTAALRRVAISLSSQRRALRHSAGASSTKTSSAAELKKRIREEVMNGTLARRAVNSRTETIVKGIVVGILAAMLAVAAHSTPVPRATGADGRVEMNREVDRAKVENLQRWASAGHEEWCKDARLVAMDELRRVAPAFAENSGDLEALPLDTESESGQRVVLAWTSPDGRATYHITVERFEWLLPIAGKAESIVWVPTHVEVIAHC